MRCFEPDKLEAMRPLVPTAVGFEPRELLKDGVFLLLGDDGALFEYDAPGTYTGHFLFREARGKTAVNISNVFLTEMFDTYGAEVIRGLTPVSNRAALWMARRLGFTSYGIVETCAGDMELFILSKKDFK